MAKKENRSEEIVNNAIRLIYQNGFKRTTLRQLAELSGVSHPAVYNYVRSKSDICVIAMDRFMTSMGAIADQFVADSYEEKDSDTVFAFYWIAYYRLIKKDNQFSNMVRDFSSLFISDSPTEAYSKYARSMYKDLFGYDYIRSSLDYFIDNLIVANAQTGIESAVSGGFLSPVDATARLAEVSKAVMKINIKLTKRKLVAFDAGIDWNYYLRYDILEEMLLTKLGNPFSE